MKSESRPALFVSRTASPSMLIPATSQRDVNPSHHDQDFKSQEVTLLDRRNERRNRTGGVAS